MLIWIRIVRRAPFRFFKANACCKQALGHGFAVFLSAGYFQAIPISFGLFV